MGTLSRLVLLFQLLIEATISSLRPIQSRYQELISEPEELNKILSNGRIVYL